MTLNQELVVDRDSLSGRKVPNLSSTVGAAAAKRKYSFVKLCVGGVSTSCNAS